MSRKSPDRRLGCNASVNNPTKFFGGCSQQSQISMSAIKIKYNTTKMSDYQPDPYWNASGVTPYGWANQDGVVTGQGTAGAAPFCSDYCYTCIPPYVCGAVDGTGNGSLPCGLPDPSNLFGSGIANEVSFSAGLGPYKNYYSQSEATKSYSHCSQVGFKNAYSYKTHFGRLGYTSRMETAVPDLIDWSGCGCSYHSYDASPDTTRYLSFTANSSFSRTYAVACINTYDGGTYDCCGEPNPCVKANCCEELGAECWTGTDTGNASATSYVNRYSGNAINNCSSGSGTYSTNAPACDCTYTPSTNCTEADCACGESTSRLPEDIAATLYYNAAEALADLAKVAGNVGDIGSLWSFPACYAPDCRCTVSSGGAAASATFQIRRTCYANACDFVGADEWVTIKSMAINYSAGTSTDTVYSEYRYGYVGCPADSTGCVPYSAFYTRAYSFSATSATYSEEWNSANSESVWSTGTKTVTGTLGSPYTTEEVYQDCVNLLSHLPLDRDDLLPWRTDGNITTGPLCHYDERGSGMPSLSCQSDSGSLPSGYIYGICAPPGIDHVFNPGMLEYCVCTDYTVEPPNTCQYVKKIGMWNDIIGGGSPTCWTNAYEASNIPQGAFVSNYTFQVVPCSNNWDAPTATYVSNRLWMGKWAEILIPNRRSLNYARPCAADRFLISESTNRCVSSVTDQTLTYDWVMGESNLVSGQKVWVCGVGGIADGCYTADNIGGYQITLTGCVVSASSLPDVPVDDCGTGMFGILKYQNCTGVCGRVDITSVGNSTPITCSLMEPTYLVNNDLIRITGATGGAPINNYWRVIVIDPSTIALSGSRSGSWGYTANSGQLYDPWATDWKWNDTDPKGDYTAYEWEYDYRTIGEYNRLVASAAWNAGLTYAGDLTNEVGCPVTCDQTCPGPPQIPFPHPNGCYGGYLDKVECTDHCLQPNACSPIVAFWSPNGETFNSGTILGWARNHGFGHPSVIDEQYGTLWQGAFRQYQADPYWSPPPCACAYDGDLFVYDCEDCSLREDSGACQGDEGGPPCIKYYAKRPMFESRCTVPTGAPPPPNQQELGCKGVDEGNCGRGNVCYGPYWDGNSFLNQKDGCDPHEVPWSTPWVDYLNEFNCICAEGRFATEYSQNGISCDTNLFVPAP